KGGIVGKRSKPKSPLKLLDEFVDEGVLVKEPASNKVEANLQQAMDLSLKELEKKTQGPARPVVFREPDSGRFQPLLETLKKNSPVDQFIFQRPTSMSIESSRNAEFHSIDAELTMTDSVMESDKEVPLVNREKDASYKELTEIDTGDQVEDQAGRNPGSAAESQPQPSHVVHARPNLEHIDLKENLKLPTEDQAILKKPVSSTRTLTSLQNINKELSFTNQFLMEKPREEEPEKTNTESEVQSMVTVPVHLYTSLVPPMTNPVIDLAVSQPVSITVQVPLPTSTTIATTITTTTLSPPPPHPQQSTTDSIVLQRIGELEKHMADLLQNNLALEERLDKHGSRLYNLENLNIPHQEILQQRMFEDKSYEAHENHKNLFDALQKSLKRDNSNQLLSDLEAARQKKRKRHDLPITPSDSMMNDDSIPDEQIQFYDDEDTKNDHLPKADTRKDWWKPLPEEERPATPEPAWIIPSSNISNMTAFLNWYCQKINKIVLTQVDFEGKAYEVVKAFYPDVIHIQSQMEDCHKMLVDQIDWAIPKGDQVRIDVSRSMPVGGPLGHVTIQTQFCFNKDLEYLRYGNKGSRPALSISKMKAARYPDFGLKLLVSEQLRIDDACTYDISAKYGISHWWFNRHKFYIDRHDSSVDFQEHTIAEKDLKNLYPNNFKDLNMLLLQGHLDHLPGSNKRMLSTTFKLWTRNLVTRQRVKDFQLDIKSYQTQLNLTKPEWDATGYEFKHDYTSLSLLEQ
nr:hypothetical protein [Tanacetum cinerariifolium]